MKLLRTAFLAGLGAITAMAADPGLLNLLDPGANIVAGIHVDRSVSSQFGQFLMNQMQSEDAGFKNFVQTTGFDPRRDLREVVTAATAGGTGHGVVVARGYFDIAKLTAALKAQGGTATKYNGFDVLSAPASRGDHAGWVAFLDSNTAVAGDQALVKSALDRRTSAASLDPKLVAKIQEVSNKYDAWMVSLAPVSTFAGHMPDKNLNGALKGDVMQGIEMTSGGVSFGSTVNLYAEAVTRSEKDAQALMDVAKFLTGMIQLNRDKAEVQQIASLLDTLDLKVSSNTVSMSLAIPEANLEKMVREGTTRTKKPQPASRRIVYKR